MQVECLQVLDPWTYNSGQGSLSTLSLGTANARHVFQFKNVLLFN